MIFHCCRKKKTYGQDSDNNSVNKNSTNFNLSRGDTVFQSPTPHHPLFKGNDDIDLESSIIYGKKSNFPARPGEIRINEDNFDKYVPVKTLNSGQSRCGLCKDLFNPEIETRILECGDLFQFAIKIMLKINSLKSY
jgi:hypothetical protein